MIISEDWNESASFLLKMIVEHWVTVRGFSYAGAFIEKYKQRNKQTLEKSKGLRKKLISNNKKEDDK